MEGRRVDRGHARGRRVHARGPATRGSRDGWAVPTTRPRWTPRSARRDGGRMTRPIAPRPTRACATFSARRSAGSRVRASNSRSGPRSCCRPARRCWSCCRLGPARVSSASPRRCSAGRPVGPHLSWCRPWHWRSTRPIRRESYSPVPAATTSLPLAWHAGLPEEDRIAIKRAVRDGTMPVLFASPEAVLHSLSPALFAAAAAGLLRAIVIDEALSSLHSGATTSGPSSSRSPDSAGSCWPSARRTADSAPRCSPRRSRRSRSPPSAHLFGDPAGRVGRYTSARSRRTG